MATGIRVTPPSGDVLVRGDFALVPCDLPEPDEGELAIRALMVSVDPYLMMLIRSGAFPEGRVRSRIIGRVEASRAPGFAPGDLVLGFGRRQDRDCIPAGEMRRLEPAAPLSAYLGIAGHSGFTAMVGMRLLDPQPGRRSWSVLPPAWWA